MAASMAIRCTWSSIDDELAATPQPSTPVKLSSGTCDNPKDSEASKGAGRRIQVMTEPEHRFTVCLVSDTLSGGVSVECKTILEPSQSSKLAVTISSQPADKQQQVCKSVSPANMSTAPASSMRGPDDVRTAELAKKRPFVRPDNGWKPKPVLTYSRMYPVVYCGSCPMSWPVRQECASEADAEDRASQLKIFTCISQAYDHVCETQCFYVSVIRAENDELAMNLAAKSASYDPLPTIKDLPQNSTALCNLVDTNGVDSLYSELIKTCNKLCDALSRETVKFVCLPEIAQNLERRTGGRSRLMNAGYLLPALLLRTGSAKASDNGAVCKRREAFRKAASIMYGVDVVQLDEICSLFGLANAQLLGITSSILDICVIDSPAGSQCFPKPGEPADSSRDSSRDSSTLREKEPVEASSWRTVLHSMYRDTDNE